MSEHGGTFRVARESPNKYEITIVSREIIPYYYPIYTDGTQHHHSGADRDGHHTKWYPGVSEPDVIRLAKAYSPMNLEPEFVDIPDWQRIRGDVEAVLHVGK